MKKVDGVISYYVDSEKDQATVKYDTKRTNPEIIKQAIIKGGYKVGGIKELEN